MEQQDGNERLLDETLAVWQPHAGRQLAREDAREIVENVVGFFRTLLAWDAEIDGSPGLASRMSGGAAPGEDT